MSFFRVPNDSAISGRLVERYRELPYFFPIIMAVLSGRQSGEIYVDNLSSPGSFFVEHRFGFSQLCGKPDAAFTQGLANHLLRHQDFAAPKIRCYAPGQAALFLQFGKECERSQRAQFRLPVVLPSSVPDALPLTDANADEVNEQLGTDLFGRFWRSRADFLDNSFGFTVRQNGKFASICYAAAIADGVAEIDVATMESARRRGLARWSVAAFIGECGNRGLTPNWDCFTNNVGSMRLASSIGFRQYGAPYDFFTIKKTSPA